MTHARKIWLVGSVLLASVLTGALAVTARGPTPQAVTTPLGMAFTYQAQLRQNGAPVNGTLNLTFRLYDAPSGGTVLGTIPQSLPLAGGLFTTQLDFGNQFNGLERFLGIGIGADPELPPRQRLSAVPYALRALSASAWILPVTAQSRGPCSHNTGWQT